MEAITHTLTQESVWKYIPIHLIHSNLKFWSLLRRLDDNSISPVLMTSITSNSITSQLVRIF